VCSSDLLGKVPKGCRQASGSYWLSVPHCPRLLLQQRKVVLQLVLHAIPLIEAGVAGNSLAPVPYGYLKDARFQRNLFACVLDWNRVTVCFETDSGECVAADNGLLDRFPIRRRGSGMSLSRSMAKYSPTVLLRPRIVWA